MICHICVTTFTIPNLTDQYIPKFFKVRIRHKKIERVGFGIT